MDALIRMNMPKLGLVAFWHARLQDNQEPRNEDT